MSDHVALGALTATFPPSLVDAVLAQAGKVEQRVRLLPARLVVYFVLAMALFADADYAEVMRQLVEGLAWQSGWRRRWTVPSTAAISLGRARLGSEPVRLLFDRACVPIATEQTPGGFWRGLRLVGMDGSTLDVADTPANAAEFARPGSGRGEGVGAFPQLRLVGLAECATHTLFAVALDSYATGEITLAKQLAGALTKDMLVFADRNFLGHPLFSVFAATAQLCWRAKGNAVLPVVERFADGSFRSEIVASDDKRTRATSTSLPLQLTSIEKPAMVLYRLLQLALDHDPVRYRQLVANPKPKPVPPDPPGTRPPAEHRSSAGKWAVDDRPHQPWSGQMDSPMRVDHRRS